MPAITSILSTAAAFVGLGLAIPHSSITARQLATRSDASPSVTVKNGTIAGIHQPDYNQDFFLGIPFAQPPLEQLRFRNPQSINASYDGVFQATEYAPMCYGYGGDQIGYPQSEDCLYLNVVRPSGYENQSLPVGVWIHGGGLYQGGSRDDRYNLTFIVENAVRIGKPFIAVSIAYRLGPWGFLQSEEVSTSGDTNIGLRDQRLALHWLHENIDAFGGDCRKVTIWGESAGAGSVGWHITAYGGRDDGLFRAGIMQSGNPVPYNGYETLAKYQPQYDALVDATNCTMAADTLTCLREVPSDSLAQLFSDTSSLNEGWRPIVDGDFIQRLASAQLAEGAFVKVPILTGANTDEGTAFGPQGIDTDDQFRSYVADRTENPYIPEDLADEVLAAYPNTPAYFIPPVENIGNYTFPASYGAQYRRAAAYAGDVTFIAHRRGASETWAANGLAAYSYRFNTVPAGIDFYVGATHFQEVAFVFNNTLGLGYNEEHGTVNPFLNKSQSYYDLAAHMSKSWASFIYDSDPNYEVSWPESAPAWPQYSLDKPENIVWDANVSALAFVEPDTFREEGIRWILDHAEEYNR
ncbi:cholinesterase [Sphaerulina musiva SO2202]|uniref:Carboxylic ester hydrolase n=1 Tax=Sphaerulina musiva (strain SO2202) TaxID=692275 RepID=M3D7H2_SPHMS|nr:cholinesterase [Sphaerulina musiva SO2202]EMF13824.1 cholinesterase [Sphaerulina musiva SO2202]